MTAYNLVKFLHVLSMFGAVAAALIAELLVHRVARTADVAGIRSFMASIRPVGALVPILFVGGAIFGFITAAIGPIDFFRPWLLASYVLFIIAMVTGAVVAGPWAESVAKAAHASPLEQRSPELELAIDDRRGKISTTILMSSIVAIIFLMVVKPGG